MKTIGITGGIGAGKSLILNYIRENYNAKVYLADEIANKLKLPGEKCYEGIVKLLGREILTSDNQIDNYKMAQRIFGKPELLQAVNELIHPAVKSFVINEIKAEKENGQIDYFILEAALLIEGGYGSILDELWYIYAREEIRQKRLKESRNYSDEKIQRIMDAQLSENEFRQHCKVTIDNNTDEEFVYFQIDNNLEGKISGSR